MLCLSGVVVAFDFETVRGRKVSGSEPNFENFKYTSPKLKHSTFLEEVLSRERRGGSRVGGEPVGGKTLNMPTPRRFTPKLFSVTC
jgi:hypothetical protein